jgi:predicted enzyme related to lactoylglutathione lyase
VHKSKLGGFIIDCQNAQLPAAAGFWGAALGMATRAPPADESQQYVHLVDPAGRVNVEVQSVPHESRVHLDIETDDIEAEVRRLEALGAKRIEQISTWWVMQAPTGQRFCVVRVVSAAFADEANSWS